MSELIRTILILTCLLPSLLSGQSNERVKLEAERKKLTKEIAYIQKLLNENKGSKSATLGL